MSTPETDQVAEVIQRHACVLPMANTITSTGAPPHSCSCGQWASWWPLKDAPTYAKHVAARVLAVVHPLAEQAAIRGVDAVERERVAAQCQEWAVKRFAERGPTDARGATLWDVAAWLREEAGAPSATVPLSTDDVAGDYPQTEHVEHVEHEWNVYDTGKGEVYLQPWSGDRSLAEEYVEPGRYLIHRTRTYCDDRVSAWVQVSWPGSPGQDA